MKHIEYTPKGVCSSKIIFDLTDDGKIKNLNFVGGCNGNLNAISRLLEGQDAKDTSSILKGNLCGTKNTSCADQLAKALESAIKKY